MPPLPPLLEALPLAVAVVAGPEARILAANAAWCRTLPGAPATLDEVFPDAALLAGMLALPLGEAPAPVPAPLRALPAAAPAGGTASWWDLDLAPHPDLPGALLVTAREATDAVLARREADGMRDAMAETGARLRLVQEAAGAGTWEWDMRSDRLAWSPEQFHLHGLDPAGDPPPGLAAWLAMVHPEDRPALLEAAGAVRDRAGILRAEFRIRRADTGEERWLLSRARVVELDRAGRPARMLGANLDLTERRREGAALRESEALLRLATESGRVGTWELDLATGRGRWSAVCGTLFGHDRRDFTAEDWLLALHPEDRAPTAARWQAALDGEAPYEIEYRAANPAADGGERWLLARGAVERDAAGRPLRGAGVLLDVTARRRAEDALRASEERLRRAQRIGRVGGFEIDFRTGVNLRSAEYMAVQGRAAASAREAHADWVARLHPDDRARAERHFLDTIAPGSRAADYAQEYRIVTPDGAVRWIAARAEIERDEAGRALAMRGAHVDVTELKEAETRLTESEARLRLALSAAALGVVEWDLAAGTMLADERVAAMSRGLLPAGRPLERDDPARRAWRSRIHPEDLARRVHHRAAVQDGVDSVHDEIRIRLPGTPEGEWDWLASRTAVVARDPATGAPLRVMDILQDVTPRRRAEAARAESEARFRALVEAMPLVAFSADPEGRTDFLNARWYEFTGQPRGAGEGEGWAAALHPEDAATTFSLWHAALRQGEPFETEHRFRRADGAWRWFLTRSLPLRAPEDGRILRWFGTATDITEIVAAREGAARAREELEARVAERTRALSEAAAELQAEMRRREATQAALLQSQKLEALGQLTSGVAHDFNNVLAAITGSYRLIARRTDRAEIQELLAHGERAAERAAALVRQLLAFARREELRPRLVHVAEVLQGTRAMLAHTLGSRIELHVAAADGIWPVLADPAQLEVALLNLAANARDAMPEGGRLVISARNLPPAERPARLRPGDHVAIAVRDTGGGMPEEVLARAGEPFFTTKPAGRGTGLGLAMVQGFAEGSSGCLRIESRLGEGTVVEIVLPRAALTGVQAEDAPDAGDVLDPARHGGAAILLAEDDEQVRPVTAAFLRDLGYRVTEAASAEAAAALAHGQDAPDLLVTDIEMPGADGVTLAARLRADRPGLPVIFVTGRPPGPAQGGEVVLRKPYTGPALAAAVLDSLGRRRAALPAGSGQAPG